MSSRLVCKLLLGLAALVAPLLAASHGFQPIQRDLIFEQQAPGPDGSSTFVGRDRAYSIRLSKAGADLISGSAGQRAVSVSMRLVGRANAVFPRGADASAATINYFVGPAAQWRTGGKAYSKVRYDGVYHGVDLVFYGNCGRLEHDFVVAPGSAPSQIQIEWTGARKLALNAQGDLLISTTDGDIQWAAPVLYQRIAGEEKRIEGAFRLLGGNRVGFRVGRYDTRAELVIDPALVFSTYLGGSNGELARGIAVDPSGNVFVTGQTNSMDLPVTAGALQTGFGGGTVNYLTGDAFVAKYSPSGALLFLTFLGGKKDDLGMGLAVDASGNVYLTGYTNSTDFPVTAGALQTKFAGYTALAVGFPLGDAFVTKLSGDGKTLLYSTYLGGAGDDAGFGIAVDSQGDAFVTGVTRSPDFPVTKGAYQPRFAGYGGQEAFNAYGFVFIGGDAFVAKLNPSGSGLVYSTYIGGGQDDTAVSIAVDNSGNAYIGGFTLSGNFPTTPGALQATFGGSEPQNFFFTFGDGFLTKLNPTGSGLVYSTLLGGSGDDWVSGVAVDSAGNLYATGSTTSTDFPVTAGAFQHGYRGPVMLPFLVDQLLGDAFLVKLNPAGQALVFGTYLGGTGDDVGMAIAFDGAGNPLVTGFTNSPDFPVTADAIQKTSKGPGPLNNNNSLGDVFLAQFNASGAELFATYFGGTANDAATSIAVSSTGVGFIAGTTGSTDFPLLKAAQTKSSTEADGAAFTAFVSSISGFGAAGALPVITSVESATGGAQITAQNTFIAIYGSNLSATRRTWKPSDFVNGQLPVQLDNVSVTVNGKPAFVYFISPGQVNVLTPLDSATGSVQVQLTNGQSISAPFTITMQAFAPGFYQFGASPYVAATHANGSYLAPATLFPGRSTPAKPNEHIVLYANGFGQTSPPIVNGSATQSGNLPEYPVVQIGGVSATVRFAGVILPGLYQINVVVPNLPDGDASISATFGGFSTQAGALLPIQH